MVTPARSTQATLTVWFLDTANPAAVLAKEPRTDKGFGIKLLKQFNPTLPVTWIGSFPVNRSAPASEDEYYIAGLPGITMVQTVVTDGTDIMAVTAPLRRATDAPVICAFILNEKTSLGGFARWERGKLVRALCAYRNRVFDDEGIPDAFERPFWAGEHNAQSTDPLDLPFEPVAMALAAMKDWVGFYPDPYGTDLFVQAYATDGRPEPKTFSLKKNRLTPDLDQVVGRASAKLGFSVRDPDYDDYERLIVDDQPAPIETVKKAAGALTRLVKAFFTRK